MTQFSQSIAKHYHQRTKYAPETIASKSKGLNWNDQPVPFKDYKIGTIVDLKPYLSNQSLDNNLSRLSKLLLCSYGLTAKFPSMLGSFVYLRSAPSAGGLYPAEVYLISSGTASLPAGLYNYHPLSHSLVNFWSSDVWPDLQKACFSHSALTTTKIALVTSAVFYRSAWRYEDRAYRRIFLDTGHLLGNIELAGSLTGYQPHLIGGFHDQAMNDLLYLEREEEGVMSVIPLTDFLDVKQYQYFGNTALPSPLQTEYQVVEDGQLLKYFHHATEINHPPTVANLESETSVEDKYNFPFCSKISTQTQPIHWGEGLLNLEKTILKRRSTRAYTGGDITFEQLKALLHFTYQPQDYLDQDLEASPDYFDVNLIETFVVVLGVTDLEEGCYYYAPLAQELRQIRFKNFRRELHFLCLGQELGRDAAAVVFHTADLSQALAKYGDRVYRYLHMDAGHLGQRLNLAAIHLNLGVSGIGGFFDDEVNEVLGIPTDEAVIYITTLGKPRQG